MAHHPGGTSMALRERDLNIRADVSDDINGKVKDNKIGERWFILESMKASMVESLMNVDSHHLLVSPRLNEVYEACHLHDLT